MQLAQILEPEDNLSYVIQKFQENLVETCEDLKSNAKEVKDLEGKINKILAGDKKKKVDAHAFIEYITGKDLSKYMASLKPKPTKKKPLSFERLTMIVIPIFKYFE
jgi:DNA repair ATPase RecN